jgi:hypothetical protein
VRRLRKQRRRLPSQDPRDRGYRRLKYVRYADDHLLGFTGPKAEAEQIRQRLEQFLRDDLKLELSREKTLITHGRSQAARFLGYDITVHHDDSKGSRGRRWTGGYIRLRVPGSVIKAKSAPYLRRGKPASRHDLAHYDDYTVVATFGSQYRGLVQYYLLAGNVYRLNRLTWAMELSMLRTLAAKHRSSVSRMAARYKAKIQTPHGLRTCFEVTVERQGRRSLVARFGGIPLKRSRNVVLRDHVPTPVRHREVAQRLLRGVCEICQGTDDIQVHQIRKLADLITQGSDEPAWVQIMAKKRRKTLILCGPCHHRIHAVASSP